MDPIFLQLKDVLKPLYLRPSLNILENIVDNTKSFCIILPLVTEAPIQNIENISTITIEKLLVDIFCDEIWESLKGSELIRIFENAFRKYAVNQSKLLRYAFRKGKKGELMNFLITNKLAIE